MRAWLRVRLVIWQYSGAMFGFVSSVATGDYQVCPRVGRAPPPPWVDSRIRVVSGNVRGIRWEFHRSGQFATFRWDLDQWWARLHCYGGRCSSQRDPFSDNSPMRALFLASWPFGTDGWCVRRTGVGPFPVCVVRPGCVPSLCLYRCIRVDGHTAAQHRNHQNITQALPDRDLDDAGRDPRWGALAW